MKQLTDKQQKIYDYLRERAQYGIPPSVREICAATGFKSTSTVHAHLRTMEEAGYISRGSGLNRSISIVGTQRTTQVPIIGRINAGAPILAVEEMLGSIPFAAKNEDTSDLFALKVQGDSMINAGILNGDYVIAQQCSLAENGEIVVALLDDETTVKRYYKENNAIRLQPENPDYEPIISPEIAVIGKVLAVFRYL